MVVLERMRLAPNVKVAQRAQRALSVRVSLKPRVQLARRLIRMKCVLVNEDVCMHADRELKPGDRVSIDAARLWIVPDIAPYLIHISVRRAVARAQPPRLLTARVQGRSFIPPTGVIDTHEHTKLEYAKHVEVDHNVLAGVYLNHVGCVRPFVKLPAALMRACCGAQTRRCPPAAAGDVGREA